MAKSLIIIGYGPGLSTALATRFGAEGYTLGLVSRTRHDDSLTQLAEAGTTAHFEAADAGDIPALQQALHRLSAKLGEVGAVVYNAAALKAADILQLAPQQLVQEFGINVAAALGSVQALLADLRQTGGAVLLTGAAWVRTPTRTTGRCPLAKPACAASPRSSTNACSQKAYMWGCSRLRKAFRPATLPIRQRRWPNTFGRWRRPALRPKPLSSPTPPRPGPGAHLT
jgi:NAD(P)-dependent dehydrogenase (short-subunit alcohol dehydrogenase family)